MKPTHLSLFTGIGGIDLAAEWAGFTTVAMCERDEFCRRVLAHHWPDVPCWEDVHDLTADALRSRDIHHVDLLSGGFPCQPFSVAGKRQGADDDRHLWPEMLRVIREVRPAWVLGENVAGFVPLALDLVAADLEASGYDVEAIVLPAGGVGAPHLRQRCFVLAHTARELPHGGRAPRSRRRPELADRRRDVADTASLGLRTGRPWGPDPGRAGQSERALQELADADLARLAFGDGRDETRGPRPAVTGSAWWATEPGLGRVAHGVPGRVDRLRALGNAVVPQQVYPILAEIHRLIMEETP